MCMKESQSLAARVRSIGFLLVFSALAMQSTAAPSDVDLSFDPGSGVNGPVNAIVVQSDGKVIIGGQFTTVKGLARRNLARLNADGSGDPSFTPGAPFTSSTTIYALALQADGKVLVGQDSYANYGLTRLNADGSYDTNFNSNAYAAIASAGPFYPFSVSALLVQPDGKVLYAGENLLRLNSNGTLDTNFNSAAIGYVYSMARQPDGKLIVGGYFYSDFVGGTPIGYGLARLNTDGPLDNTFNQAPGQGGLFLSIVLQPDGKLLVGGRFVGTNGACIARLNGNGTVDSTFAEVTGSGLGGKPETRAIGLQPDGKLLIGGIFTPINGYPRTNLARLNANGTLDLSFTNDAVGPFDASVQAISVQADGTAFLGGTFTTLNGASRSRVARLNADGSAHVGFQPGRGAVEGPITRLSLLPGGKTLAGGLVTFQNGSNQYATVRLNKDGSRDETFSSAQFTPDVGFKNSPDDYNLWTCLEVQPNGKVLVGGYTVDYYNCDENGCLVEQRPFLQRVHFDGIRDAGFNPGTPIGIPTAIAVQPDGRVLAAWIGRVARFNGDGSADRTFPPVEITQTLNGGVRDFEIQPDGKILVGGSFSKIGGTNRNGIARLNTNGTLDTTFDPGAGADGDVLAITLQSDAKILIGGAFTHFNGVVRNRIARLNPDGSLDSSFNPGADAEVSSIVLQSDGKMLVGGSFLIVNGVLRPYAARLYGDSSLPSLSIARSSGSTVLSWPTAFGNYQLQSNTNVSLSNGWFSIVAARSTNNGSISMTIPATGSRKFFRLSSPQPKREFP
jgi:uncharacterized delta-60 repeat protein